MTTTSQTQYEIVIERSQTLALILTAKLHARWSHTVDRERFEVELPKKQGQRFIRIVSVEIQNSKARSVHAFVEVDTGKIIKPATWKAPQKYSNGELASKYNLLNTESFNNALDACDPHGGWLYARR